MQLSPPPPCFAHYYCNRKMSRQSEAEQPRIICGYAARFRSLATETGTITCSKAEVKADIPTHLAPDPPERTVRLGIGRQLLQVVDHFVDAALKLPHFVVVQEAQNRNRSSHGWILGV